MLKSAVVFAFALVNTQFVATAVAATSTCEDLDKNQCRRVRAITQRWKSEKLDLITVAGIEDFKPIADAQPAPEIDLANAKAAARENLIGPCRFNEAEERIELRKSAFALSDEAFTQCLSAAFANARYHAIESQWLAKLGTTEAWVIRKGRIEQISVEGKKLEATAARSLWTSFATRELLTAAKLETANAADGRAVASGASLPPGQGQADVRELLGL